MNFSRRGGGVYILLMEIPEGWGVIFVFKKWNSREMGGLMWNSLHGGGMDIFWNYTFLTSNTYKKFYYHNNGWCILVFMDKGKVLSKVLQTITTAANKPDLTTFMSCLTCMMHKKIDQNGSTLYMRMSPCAFASMYAYTCVICLLTFTVSLPKEDINRYVSRLIIYSSCSLVGN